MNPFVGREVPLTRERNTIVGRRQRRRVRHRPTKNGLNGS
jgi:hypothetical protein